MQAARHARRLGFGVAMNLTQHLLQALAKRGATEVFGIPNELRLGACAKRRPFVFVSIETDQGRAGCLFQVKVG